MTAAIARVLARGIAYRMAAIASQERAATLRVDRWRCSDGLRSKDHDGGADGLFSARGQEQWRGRPPERWTTSYSLHP